MDQVERVLRAKLPEEVRALYSWHNGTDVRDRVLDDTHFFPGFYFVAIEDGLNHWNAFREDKRWRPEWFPIFANGGGDFYVVACKAERQDTAAVIGFMLGETSHPIEYVSVTAMMETIAECYERDIFYKTPDGYLETRIEGEEEIARRLNPGLERWSA